MRGRTRRPCQPCRHVIVQGSSRCLFGEWEEREQRADRAAVGRRRGRQRRVRSLTPGDALSQLRRIVLQKAKRCVHDVFVMREHNAPLR